MAEVKTHNSDTEIVISGISGRFPESDDIYELWENLIRGTELSSVDDRRWPVDVIDVTRRSGKVKHVEKFDAEFFSVSEHDAHYMDPQIRLLHETTWEAIFDAGFYPEQLQGSRTSVFVGACFSDSNLAFMQTNNDIGMYFHSMAPRISYAFDFRGPALTVDTACASSFSAFTEGCLALKKNICDYLIVAGVSIILNPAVSYGFKNMRMISNDGKSKCLDKNVNGYCRSETVVSLFVQKRKDAKRIYASVANCFTNTDGYKQEGITFPKSEAQKELMVATLKETEINPNDVNYIETHMTGTAVGDPAESKAIIEAYRSNGDKPLLFGCLKSNLGHTEGASGGLAVTKVCLAFQNRRIPPNINYENPNPNIEHLIKGIIVPVLKPMPFNEDIVPVNSFGFGGVNVHAILRANEKAFTSTSFQICGNILRLIQVCGRNQQSVEYMLQWLINNKDRLTNEFLYLLNEVCKINPSQKICGRGFLLLENNDIICKETIEIVTRKRLVVFFSGVNLEKCANLERMMKLKPFHDSLNTSHQIMQSFGLDLFSILNPNAKFSHLTEVLVYAVAMQIAIIDTLKYIELEVQHIIGQSIGKISAAYFDGCLSAIEALLTAFLVGKCFECYEENVVSARINLNYDQIKKHCPPGVCICGVDKTNRVYVSGPKNCINSFIKMLQAKNIATTEYGSCLSLLHHNTNLHDVIANSLRENMKNSRKFSSKWLLDDSEIYDEFCSPNFFSKLVTSEFKVIENFIPKNCCAIEVNPYSLLTFYQQSQTENHLQTFFEVIGGIHNNGHLFKIEKLYPAVNFPVPRETLSLSQLWKWDHKKSWLVTKFPDYFGALKSIKKYDVDLSDPNWKCIDGHCIDKRLLFPATGYLYLIWATMVVGIDSPERIMSFSVEFKNVKFRRATIVPKIGSVSFSVHYVPETGEFEISEGGSVCASGNVQTILSSSAEYQLETTDDPSIVTLNSKEIYRELRTRGYDYGPNFRCLVQAKSDGSKGSLKWNGSWINFADAVMQLSILEQNERCLFIPTSIDYLSVDSKRLLHAINETKSSPDKFIEVININRNYSVANGAMIVKNIIGTPTSRRLTNDQIPELEEIRFVPFFDSVILSKAKEYRVEQYVSLCSTILRKLKNSEIAGREPDLDKLVKQNIENMNGCILLKLLYDAYTNKSNVDHDLISKYKCELSKDFLLNATSQELLRSPIDLALENIHSKLVNVIECSISSSHTYDLLSFCFDKQDINFDYKLLYRSETDASQLPSNCTHLWKDEDCLPPFVSDVDFIIFKDSNTSFVISDERVNEHFNLNDFLASSYEVLKANGFLLLHFRENILPIEKEILTLQAANTPKKKSLFLIRELIRSSKFSLIDEKSDQLSNVVFLLRKTCKNLSLRNQTIVECKTFSYEWIENLKAEIKNDQAQRIWLLANDHHFNGVIGLFHCLRREMSDDKLRCVHGPRVQITEEIVEKDLKINVIKNNMWGSLRSFEIDINEHFAQTEYWYLDVQTKGDLSSLKWFESSLKLESSREDSENIICTVAFSALNFKDVMVASGKVPLNAYPLSWQEFPAIGIEFSGVDQNQNRVCGICEGGAIASKVRCSKFVWEVPNEWTLEDAATVPVAYLTVYYALLIRGKLQNRETVLIHAGSGGVGQAAISICLRMGCTVYTTVGTKEKREFLKRKFPQLVEKRIGNSRDLSFEELIMKETNGRGVDVVVNSLSENKLKASLRCMASFGRFIEIGKYDIVINSLIEPYLLEKNCVLHTICVAHLMDEIRLGKERSKALLHKLHRLIDEGIKNGTVQPLERHVFEKHEYEDAIRFMAGGKHIGKVLIKISDKLEDDPAKIVAIPQTFFDPHKSYIIVGGLGGFGLEVAYWMVSKGAKHLILTSRSSYKENYQRYAVKRLESKGAHVTVLKNDASNEVLALKVIKEAQRLAPLSGIFILPLVLKDNLIENQSVEDFNEVCFCKVKPATLFDALSRKLNLKLDYFVCFSSIVASFGNRTQSNYAFANSVLDRVCEKRREDGLHGISIQWGLIGDVGFVAEKFEDKNIVLRGSVSQRMPSCLKTLDQLLQTPFPVCLSMVRVKERNKTIGKDDLKKQICHVLGIKNPEKVNLDSTLGELGLDSLMAVEIKQTLERDYDTELSIMEIRNLSLKQLIVIESRKVCAKDTLSSQESQDELFWDRILNVAKETFVKLNKGTEGLPLFFIPPVDGHFDLMQPLTFIGRPVIGINWTSEMDELCSLENVAEYCADQLAKNYPLHEYDIIGYSFGAVLALEISNKLQVKLGNGVVKKLILLDGSCSMIKAQVENAFESGVHSSDDTEAFWNHLGFNLKIQNAEREKIRDEIRLLKTKEEKTQKLIQVFYTITSAKCEPSLLMAAIERYAKKTKLLSEFTHSRKFVGNVTLIRAKEKSIVYNFKEIADNDYGLSKDVDGEVKVICLQGFHETFISENIKAILNVIEESYTIFIV